MVTSKMKVSTTVSDVLHLVEDVRKRRLCAYCGAEIAGEVRYGIHRDGFDEGPEVDLCDGCGSGPLPTCEEIWAKIAGQRP